MKMHTSRILYGLGIFVFFFYFTKVSSAPSVLRTQSIIDVIKHDRQLCKLPTFLYENNVTRECLNVTYPEKILAAECKNMNTFLCLALYDTWNKVCQFNKPLINTTKFYVHIQQFFPDEDENGRAEFCKNLQNVTLSYEKVKPLLSPLYLNTSMACSLACFDKNEKFIPLCAILSWNKYIDDNIKKMNKNEQIDSPDGTFSTKISTGPQESKQLQDSQLALAQFSSEIRTENIKSDTKEDKVNLSNNDNKLKDIQKEESTIKIASATNVSVMLKSSVTENKNTSFATKSKDVNLNQQSNVNNDSSALNQHKKVVDKHDEKVEDSKKLENHNVNALSNEALENINDPNEDIKTSTISEDTQDHENSANQNNWNHGDTPNDANDAPDMIIDTGDQGQNIPDPSEQRDDIISHYHNITSEEESHFFTYFTVVSLISIAAYIGYHNKQKILAIVLEGRRSRNSRGRRRPSTANYRKLNCTLEEAVTSQCNANVTHVIY